MTQKKLIIIFGPPASGKMTVGRELANISGLKLFHNHMSLELVNQFFDFGTRPFRRLDHLIRWGVFEEVAKSDLPGLIFTLVWAINEKEDAEYVKEIAEIFKNEGSTIHYVELFCELEERLKRNINEDRILQKPSKKDTEASKKRILFHEEKYRMNTIVGELENLHILKIDNTHLTPLQAAVKIKDHYNL